LELYKNIYYHIIFEKNIIYIIMETYFLVKDNIGSNNSFIKLKIKQALQDKLELNAGLTTNT